MSQRAQETSAPARASESEAQASPSSSAGTVHAMIASGRRDPQAIAAVMQANPGAQQQILALLHQTLGNQFVRAVLELLLPGAAAAAERRGPAQGAMRVTANGLNVRSTPSKTAADNVVGMLHHHTIVEATGRDGDWVKIDYRGKPGYVFGEYVEPFDKPTSPASPSAHATPAPASSDHHAEKPSVTPAPSASHDHVERHPASTADKPPHPAPDPVHVATPDAVAKPAEKANEKAAEKDKPKEPKKTKSSGFARYGGGTVRAALTRLANAGKLKITASQIAQLDAVAQVETGGQVSGVDTTDDQVVSIGFHQVVLGHKSVEAVMLKASAAFAKHGLSLDMTKTYNVDGWSNPHQIQGVPDVDDLRGHEWGDRFYAASLEDDVIVAIAEFALAEAKLVESITTGSGGTGDYFADDTARAWLLEVHNNRQSYTAKAVKNAVDAGAKSAKDRDQFLDILAKGIVDAYVELEPLVFYHREMAKPKNKHMTAEQSAAVLEHMKQVYEPIGRTKATHIVTKISRHLTLPKLDPAAATASAAPAPAVAHATGAAPEHHDAPAHHEQPEHHDAATAAHHEASAPAHPTATAAAAHAHEEDEQGKHDRALHAEHGAILNAYDAGTLDAPAAVERLVSFDKAHNHGQVSALGMQLLAELSGELGTHAQVHAQHSAGTASAAPHAPAASHTPAAPAVQPAATDHAATTTPATVAGAHTFTTLKGTQVKETTPEEAKTLHLIRADARRLSPAWVLAAQNRLEVGDATGAMNTETLRALRTFAKTPLTAPQLLDEKFLATVTPGPFWVEGTNEGFTNQPKDAHANTPADHAAQAAGYASYAAYKRDVVPFKFLGQDMTGQGSGTVHKYLLARLQAAEAFLHQKYGSNNDVVLQKIQWSGVGNGGYDDAIGTQESHQHTMGLAIDIDPKQNPWFFSRSINGLTDKQMQWWYDTWEMMFYVACKVYGGDPITHDKMKTWSDTSSTEELYNKIDENRQSFEKYLELSKKSPATITETLLAHGISKDYITKHMSDIQNSDRYFHNGFGRTKETKSFTGVHEDLLVALRDVAGLAWGGTEMSSNENGDFMHFDCRETDFGRSIYEKARTKIK